MKLKVEDAQAIAKIIENQATIVFRAPRYIRIMLWTTDRMVLDKLRFFGRVYKREGETHVWVWAKQTEMREFLPMIVPFFSRIDTFVIYNRVWLWANATTPVQELIAKEIVDLYESFEAA